MSFEDPEDRELLDIVFKATNQQRNTIILRLMRLPTWKRYAQLTLQLQYYEVDITDENACKRLEVLCEEHVRLGFDLTRKVAEMVGEETTL